MKFREIASHMRNTYYLVYPAPRSSEEGWRRIELGLNGVKKYRIRARDGYFPE